MGVQRTLDRFLVPLPVESAAAGAGADDLPQPILLPPSINGEEAAEPGSSREAFDLDNNILRCVHVCELLLSHLAGAAHHLI